MVLFAPWGASASRGAIALFAVHFGGTVMGALHYRIMCIFLLRRALLFRVIEYQAGIFAMFDIVDALITRRENEAEKDTLYVVYGLLQ